jgi:hypothetical protein
MIDLRKTFGSRFRIGHDPAAVTRTERNDPWMMLLCERGIIYPLRKRRVLSEEQKARLAEASAPHRFGKTTVPRAFSGSAAASGQGEATSGPSDEIREASA